MAGWSSPSPPPRAITVFAPVSLSQSTVAASPTRIPVAGISTITLTARDAIGNLLSDGGLVVAFAPAPGDHGVRSGEPVAVHGGSLADAYPGGGYLDGNADRAGRSRQPAQRRRA